ncbi:MAG TPA: multidrug efflux RND transporter permease subunit [Bacteroidales bacterium]|nr:multidrug efflux RND transporter permease subunit [Bacteroidales bacterium]
MIANTFIRRPVTAIVIAIVITLVGLISLINLPVSQYPRITPPVVQVSGIYIGADAGTVEQTVTIPVETQVNGVPGMTYMSTTSTSDGRMGMSVNFDLGTDVDIAALDVQNRVNLALPQLPDDVRRLGLSVRKSNTGILMVVGIFSPNGTHDVRFVDNYTNIFIREAISRVKGVGDVFTRAEDFAMRIWLQPDKMVQQSITAGDVIRAIQEQNVQVAAGSVGAAPQAAEQAFEYTAFVNGRLKSEEEFGNIVVKTDPRDGSMLYLRDIARVELGRFQYSGGGYVDGKRASFLLVFQSPGSNAIQTANGVLNTLNQLKSSFPEDIDFLVPFETVSVVRVSINEVVHTLLIALLLVTVVVFIFLQNWRATLIPILAIPVSIIGTFAFFVPLDFTVNKLTLFGFVLAIGIVVDDAIIVVEAIQHNIDELHLSPREAAYRAMKEISGPVVAIALVLAAVFVPVGFIPGIVGKLYQQFAITIAISVLISAFVALSLTPALCSLLLKRNPNPAEARHIRVFDVFNHGYKKVQGRYTRFVEKTFRHTKLVVIFLVCLLAGTLLLFKNKPTGFIPTEDEGRVFITFELPEASSISRSTEVLQRVMKILDEVPGIGHYAAITGLNVVSFSNKSNAGTVFCSFDPWDERKSKSLQLFSLINTLEKRFAEIHDARIVIIPPPAIPGLGRTGGFSFILQQRESTDDIHAFEKVAGDFMNAARKRPELSNTFTFFTARTPGYQIQVDREKCKKMGVNLSDVYSTLQTFLGSRYVNDFTLYSRNFRVVVQADTLYRNSISQLGNYYVRNEAGSMLPLSTLINYNITENAQLIPHYNLYRSAEFNGNAAEGYSSGQALQALTEVAAETLPAGYGYEFSGLSREEIIAGNTTVMIFFISLIFAFLFLAALYESWSAPLAVLLAVPLGAFGAITALTLNPSLSNNVYAQIGLVTLIGLAAKNAILIVEFAKVRVDCGMDIVHATLEAVQLRLRPILMTSFAFIFGVSPLIFAGGAGAVARHTIGWTVLGGMLAATFLGVVIVPVLFVLIIRLTYGEHKLEKLKRDAVRREEKRREERRE